MESAKSQKRTTIKEYKIKINKKKKRLKDLIPLYSIPRKNNSTRITFRMHMKKRIRVKKKYIYNNFIIITKSYNKKKMMKS